MKICETAHSSESLWLFFWKLLLMTFLHEFLMLFSEKLIMLICNMILMIILLLLNILQCNLTVKITIIHNSPHHADHIWNVIFDIAYGLIVHIIIYHVVIFFKLQLDIRSTTLLHLCAEIFYFQIRTDNHISLLQRYEKISMVKVTVPFLGWTCITLELWHQKPIGHGILF